MNPIAFLAFILGINSTPPATPVPTDQKEKAEQTQPEPGKHHDGPKRGGWDRN